MLTEGHSKFKVLAIICFLFQLIFLVLVYQNPVNGYELSIYANIPILAFVLLSLGIFGGIIIILFNLSNNNRFWIIGYLISIFGFFLFIILPYIKGYQLYGISDVFTHIGIEKDIIHNGYFSNTNFYPIMHLWVSIVSIVTGISLIAISNFLAAVTSIFFLIFIFLFNSSIFKNKQKVVIASSLAIIPFLSLYYVQFVPNGLSLMLVPLILYLYFREDSLYNNILILVFLILIPFSHPLTCIVLLIYIFSIEISRKIYAYFKGKDSKLSFNRFLILLITFFAWISSSLIFSSSIGSLLSWTKGELYAPLSQVTSSLDKLQMTLLERFFLFFKMYGPQLMLLFFALIASIIILKKLRVKNHYSDEGIFAILLCVIIGSSISLMFLLTGDPEFRAIRSFSFIFMLSLPLAGYCIYEIVKRAQNSSFNRLKIIYVFLALLITSSSIIGFLALYPSPYISQPSQYASASHETGMYWFFEHKDTNTSNVALDAAAPWRFGEKIYGQNMYLNRKDINQYKFWFSVPNNLGYSNFSNIGMNYEKNNYFPLAKIDKMEYTDVWNQYRYNNNDFNKLDNDYTVDKLYSSGDMDIYYILGIKK